MWWLLASLALAEPPSIHTEVYYNARMALREGEPLEATKLWMLRNALRDQTGMVSAHDPDFHSITWAALGQLGICQDGHPTDEDGAGLWPIAMHNWIVQNRSRKGYAKGSRPFESFELGRQQRAVAIGDVLSARELDTVKLRRTACVRPRLILMSSGEYPLARLSDRMVSARVLHYLLMKSRDTLAAGKIRGRSVIEARLFDIALQQTQLAERVARREAAEKAQRGRELGLSRDAVRDLLEGEPTYRFDGEKEAQRVLTECVDWSVDDWMALSPDRRMFLFHHASLTSSDVEKLDAIALGVIDRLISANEGAEVEQWIGLRTAVPPTHGRVWGEQRGLSLLALDDASGFGERGVIALHRGVGKLERGDLTGSMQDLALALKYAPESRSSAEVHSLALRWLTYISSQFEITDELLGALRELLPAREYTSLLEDLLWSAALRADRRSFDLGARNQVGRTALERRSRMLDPLADGQVGRFTGMVRDGLRSSPSETLRFLDQFVQRLEREDAGVRSSHLTTLLRVAELLEPLANDGEGRGRSSRVAGQLSERCLAIVEGLEGQALSLAPGSDVFAGAVRLAPTDALPWPFAAPQVAAPSIFAPLMLVPEEWTGPDGKLVFGWSIQG